MPPVVKLHADEPDIDADLVGRLLAAQFPQWAGLPVARDGSAGTDNVMFRLGAELAVRLPRVPMAVGQVHKEQRWLPRLAPELPLAIPAPVGLGAPAEGYPWAWSVYRWLEGETASMGRLADPVGAAAELGGFLAALRRIDTEGGPPSGTENFSRGVPLARRDALTREAIAALGDEVDTEAVTSAWEASLRAPVWAGPPTWVHGDLSAGNLLVRQGRLSAVIDFGGLAVGDPAVDALVAWNLFSGDSRQAFRAALGLDDAAWARGRGWALSVALIALPYYLRSDPGIVASSRHIIAEVLADRRRVG
jgi:aminoglycoside phosphotransferase (APT) family kinase protein